MRTVILWSKKWPWVSIKNSRSNYPLKRKKRAVKPVEIPGPEQQNLLTEIVKSGDFYQKTEEIKRTEQQILPLQDGANV